MSKTFPQNQLISPKCIWTQQFLSFLFFCLPQAVKNDNGSVIYALQAGMKLCISNFFDFQRPEQYHCLNIIYCKAVLIIQACKGKLRPDNNGASTTIVFHWIFMFNTVNNNVLFYTLMHYSRIKRICFIYIKQECIKWAVFVCKIHTWLLIWNHTCSVKATQQNLKRKCKSF